MSMPPKIYDLLILLLAVLILFNILALFRGERRKSRESAEDEHYKRGRACLIKGLYEEAELEFEKSLKVNPKDAEAHYQLGKIYRERGKRKKAIKEFEKYLRLDKEKKWKEEVEGYLRG
jgi:tetratricopeptide (TPR) repeat protein